MSSIMVGMKEEKKFAPMKTIIEFVVRNMYEKNVKMCDCPDPMAYTFWKSCQEDEKFRLDFLKNTAFKLLPSKIIEEETDEKNWDGKVTVDLIEKLESWAEEAMCKKEVLGDQ